MKIKERITNFLFKTKKRKYISIAIFAALIIFTVTTVIIKISSSKITSDQISSKLSLASELTTSKLNGRGITFYDDAGIPVISKSNFIMLYDYTVRAGIDIKEVTVDVNNFLKVATITLPPAKILEIKVDPASIEYHGESFALFNLDEREDAIKAQAVAEDDALREAKDTGILRVADAQSEALIKGLLVDVVPHNYKIEIIRK